MQFTVSSENPTAITSACLVAAIGADGQLSATAKQLDDASQHYISQLVEQGDLTGKFGQTLLLHKVPGIQAERILLVGTGKTSELSDSKFRKLVGSVVAELKKINVANAALTLPEIELKGRSTEWKSRIVVESVEAALYVFDQMKSKKDEAPALSELVLLIGDASEISNCEVAINQGQAIAHGVSVARTLGNLPGNVCTPSYLADQANKLAESQPNLSTTILDEKEMKKLKMGSLLSVAKGSEQPPKLIVMEYHGGSQDEKPHVLVGKGITFDSGGISLKPGEAMDEMKFDMCGAAGVIGTMHALAELGLSINVVGIVAAAENMPSGRASKPGDIVTTMAGKTVEVLNTDAEGRLVLCDALTYAERFKPASVIDIATLTGACVIALGNQATGLFANNEELAQRLLEAGKEADDRAWHMPLWDEYQQQLDSNFADMANIGGRPAGSITAACFLSRFTEKFTWAHLDIAGTAWHSGKEKGATGRPVGLLTQYLLERAEEQTQDQGYEL